ncbi:hypothetical protein [Synechococcus sp. BDU 130192]|uniref:hypothetical protein n=1 Tax=Synechococcus sp. BDU 130192 TaxID=2042059 RepID=UPI000C06F3EB|nr:hypothetical protein [Synechococcus sp. BDU 130192]
MTFSPQLMRAVETLQYRATVGEVATQAGLELNVAQNGLYNLAADAGGHLQVAETGDVVFEFPKNFRTILRNKYFKIRLQEWLDKTWRVVFFLIRISFGIALILSILLMTIAILALVTAASSQDNNNSSRRRSSSFNLPWLVWWGPNPFRVFSPNYYGPRRYGSATSLKNTASNTEKGGMNFLEAVFSFLFGDGDPNPNLEERRWQTIGQVIQNNDGAVIAEQLSPYFDKLSSTEQTEESYMLPVLARFNGYPEVSPTGDLVYYFPELQVKAQERRQKSVPNYLEEQRWTFTLAPTGQKFLAIALGGVNLVLALMLGVLLQDSALVAELGGLVGLAQALYPLLFAYAIAFLAVPLGRYFWLQRRNQTIENRNAQRQERAALLNTGEPELQQKLAYAQRFATQKILTGETITYGTDQDLLDQQLQGRDDLAKDWERRLEEGQ